jgi:hypothetical protein
MSRKLNGDHCRCMACGEYFNSTAAFDKHRVGDYAKGRACLTVQTMESKGMARNNTGWWVTSLYGERRSGDLTHPATPAAGDSP